MRVRLAVSLTLLAIALPACGDSRGPLPLACHANPATVLAALRAAPGHVALPAGTLLSTCVGRAIGNADLQNVGAVFTDAADRLARAVPTSDAAALQLGFLIGGAERGAQLTGGVSAELINRLNQTLGLEGAPPARRAAFDRGQAAGRTHG